MASTFVFKLSGRASGARRLQIYLRPEKQFGDVMLDVFLQLFESFEGFAFELDQRITLSYAAQLDPNSEHIEVVDVISPDAVHDLQHDVPLKPPHDGLPGLRQLQLFGGGRSLPVLCGHMLLRPWPGGS